MPSDDVTIPERVLSRLRERDVLAFLYEQPPPSPEALSSSCERLRRALYAPSEEARVLIANAPEVIEWLWASMRLQEGEVPPYPKLTSCTPAEVVADLLLNDGERRKALNQAIDVVVGWCARRQGGEPATTTGAIAESARTPVWDRASRRLCLGSEVLRTFPREAPAQFAVLDVLQAAGWPLEGAMVPLRCGISLKDAVEALNEALAASRLRIGRGDGDRRVTWYVPPD
jgi:hypothetical protein